MTRQPAPTSDPALLDAAVQVITRHGYGGLTLERLAEAAHTSRMTLHRRGVVLADVVAGLSLRAVAELHTALFPVLSAVGPADHRLRQALVALFDVADAHLPLLAGLFSDDAGVFHALPDETGALPTDDVFVRPFARLLADGAADGTLLAVADPHETATVLFNTVGWGYVQLRHAQRWPAPRAQAGVLALALDGLRPDRPGRSED